ncbi:helix-turn-helix domain-containing protein [Hymenobacter sp. IS2118]|uniref:helix-turn-helix domain-containing protein n=1 Tax=Hymenobacter sp. IS2118 TaxID=1505605 RepID=UPI000907096F|nr:helix-turn-helix transcriptional regulator [Hymenobacter sp. IS2118]
MVERIRKLLESRQLTPTQFADAIGIARPIVSHILSGRNKPSLEVVQRILGAMPELSMAWLLNGTGPMQTGVVPAATPEPQQPPAQAVFATQKTQQEVITPQQELAAGLEPTIITSSRRSPATANAGRPAPAVTSKAVPRRFTAALPKSAFPQALSPEEPPLSPAVPPTPKAAVIPDNSPVASQPAIIGVAELPVNPVAVASPTASALFAGAEKPIRRIVIFYADGSFADYQPE